MTTPHGNRREPGPIVHIYVSPGGTVYPTDAEREIVWRHQGDVSLRLRAALEAAEEGARVQGITVDQLETYVPDSISLVPHVGAGDDGEGILYVRRDGPQEAA